MPDRWKDSTRWYFFSTKNACWVVISIAYEQENMNQEKKLGVYMDFLYSSPDSRFQKKIETTGARWFRVLKNWFIRMICDMSIINITKINFSGTYTDLQRQMPLRNALNFYPYNIVGTTSIFVTKSGRGVSWRSKTQKRLTVHKCWKWTVLKDKKDVNWTVQKCIKWTVQTTESK